MSRPIEPDGYVNIPFTLISKAPKAWSSSAASSIYVGRSLKANSASKKLTP